MKFRTLAAISIALLAIPATSLAEISAGVSQDYTSRYIWRGFDLDGPALQPGASVGYSPIENLSISAGVWANYYTTEADFTDEIDYSIDLGYTVNEMLSLSFGYINYDFPQDDFNTQEIYLGAAVALPADVEVSATVYYDYDEGEGYYATLGASYSLGLKEDLGASFSGSAGYMEYDDEGIYAGLDAFSDVTLSAGLEYALSDAISASCSVNYAIVPDDDVNEDNEFWYMVGLSASM